MTISFSNNTTQVSTIIAVLEQIPKQIRNVVQKLTLDMATGMNFMASCYFPKARKVTDRFHML
ncbi:transposase [Taibaiella soli]|uniref:Transposase IS204/IS1001/IS1096/IS1165 DDE domain-containing protein n=1 Tax=Taibaiella soli TaxID=1649169 RepID=A0A2W2BDK5_9BACT|nr:transposase [Taibaiella soli]PZF74339.1 hypothetical protein DN068_03510 [Taibaiella soli]